MPDPAITVRVATPADSRTLELLAWRTRGSRPPAGTTLLAERDGVPLGAISLTGGTLLADPRETTLDIAGALRFTRYRIMRQGGQTGASRSLLSRPRPGFTVSAKSAIQELGLKAAA
jgi:hypothetical protein